MIRRIARRQIAGSSEGPSAMPRIRVAFGVLCALMLAAPAPAQQDCTLPEDIAALHAVLATLAEGGAGPADARALTRLRALLATMPEAGIVDRLEERRLDSLVPVVLEMLSVSARMADSGVVARPARLSAMLEDSAVRLDGACRPAGFGIFRGGGRGTPSAAPGMDDETGAEDLSRVQQTPVATRVGLLVGLLAVFIALLYGLDASFRWVMARIFNRKTCAIGAVARSRDARIVGQVVTLGLGGVRFAPEDSSDIADMVRGTPLILEIGDQRLDAVVSAVGDEVVDCRFDRRLALAVQKSLLTLSTTSPAFVAKARRRKASAGGAPSGPADGARPPSS